MTDTTTLADGLRRIAVLLSLWWCTCFETATSQSTGIITGRIRLAYPVWLHRSHMCPPARCEHGALLEGVPLRNTRFAEADLRGASTCREVAHRLAYPPRGHGVAAVPRPALLTKQGAPQDPRQDLTSQTSPKMTGP